MEIVIAPRVPFEQGELERPRFITQEGRAITRGAFADRVRAYASWLLAAGMREGERACIFAQNSVEWMAAALGIQAAGGVMVPIYASSTFEQAAYIAEHSGARFAFVGSLDQRRVIPVATIAELGAVEVSHHPAFERRLASVSLDQPALMLYTSGTSGPPKGVPLTHRNVGVNALDWLECMRPVLHDSAIDLLWLPMSHVFGFGEACLGNQLGWTTHLCDPKSVVDRLREVKPTVFMSVPSVWEKLAQAEDLMQATGGRLRLCLSGGAGLKREVKEKFLAHGVLLIEGYGLTECSPTLTLNRPDAYRFDSVGKPVRNVDLRLADDGEILARGPSVFGGYHRDPEATRDAFTADGWFKTGDVGRFTEDGFLQIVDRKKDILVTAGGKNIPPVNIEQRFQDDPLVQHVVVYGDGKKYLVAGVWPAPGATPELLQRSIERVNAQLASHETIKRFVVIDTPLTVEAGLLTPTLKVRRRKVYEAFREQLEALYP
jgi:long-chain acyl-CoA synthetase